MLQENYAAQGCGGVATEMEIDHTDESVRRQDIVGPSGFFSSLFTLHPSLFIVLIALASGLGFREVPVPRAFVLAGEPLAFDAALRPRFSEGQLRLSAPSTRAGLARWAATPNGQRTLAHFNTDEFCVTVIEDSQESGAGRAPQPGLATLVAAAKHRTLKHYDLILNPGYGANSGFDAVPGEPSTPSDMMAVAWAAEM